MRKISGNQKTNGKLAKTTLFVTQLIKFIGEYGPKLNWKEKRKRNVWICGDEEQEHEQNQKENKE